MTSTRDRKAACVRASSTPMLSANPGLAHLSPERQMVSRSRESRICSGPPSATTCRNPLSAMRKKASLPDAFLSCGTKFILEYWPSFRFRMHTRTSLVPEQGVECGDHPTSVQSAVCLSIREGTLFLFQPLDLLQASE